MPVYRLDAEKIPLTYEFLRDAANGCPEDPDAPVDFDSYLSPCDLAGSGLAVRLTDVRTGLPAALSGVFALEALYSRLRALDARDGSLDGKIGGTKPLLVEAEPLASDLSQTIFAANRSAVMQVRWRVNVDNPDEDNWRSGTAFIVERAVVSSGKKPLYRYEAWTAAHILEGMADDARGLVVVVTDAKGMYTALPAGIVGCDPWTDFAAIAFTTPLALPVVSLGDSDQVAPSDAVVTLGNAHDQGVKPFPGRVFQTGIGTDVGLYVFDTIALEGAGVDGMSGGPAFNAEGQAIGIFFQSPEGASGFPPRLIPINRAKASAKK